MSRRSVSVSCSDPVTVGGYLKFAHPAVRSCAPFEIRSHKIRQSIAWRESSAANERLCMGTPNSRHVRAIPLPSGRWRAWRRIDTGHAGRLHSRERARGHVQPRCRGGENVGRGKGCRRRHRSGGRSAASRDADGRGLHSAAQRTSNRDARWQADGPPQQKPARRHDHPRVIASTFNPRSRCTRSPRPTRGCTGFQIPGQRADTRIFWEQRPK